MGRKEPGISPLSVRETHLFPVTYSCEFPGVCFIHSGGGRVSGPGPAAMRGFSTDRHRGRPATGPATRGNGEYGRWGDARRYRPCREKSKEPIGLRRPSAGAPTRSLAGPHLGCVEFRRPLPPHLPVIEKGRPMLSLTKPLVMRFVLAAAVTLPAAAYAADAAHADHAAKDACITACNECQRACRECIVGCDCPGCEKTCLTCIETCRTCVALLEYDSAMAEEMCEVCEEACEQCADECTKCGDEPCCKACAAACQKCRDACRAMRQ